MKPILILLTMILFLPATYGFAQMGHGMMRDNVHKDMMKQDGMTGTGHMMDHDLMMENMKGVTQNMSTMMSRMTEIIDDMSKADSIMSRDRMHRMSNIMRNVSAEMNRMSWIMDKGSVTDEEMKTMLGRMKEIQKQLSEY